MEPKAEYEVGTPWAGGNGTHPTGLVFSSPEAAAGLSKRLAAAMLEITSLEKRGTNTYFKYKFVTSEDVKWVARKALANHDIGVIPSMIDTTVSVFGQNRAGKNIFMTRIHWLYTLVCPEGFMTIPWESEALDDQDKGLSKGGTSALKYFLINLLQIPTGDEPDSDAQGPAGNGASNPEPTNGDSEKGAEYWAEYYQRPMAPDRLKKALERKSGKGKTKNDPSATKAQQGLIAAKLNELFEAESDSDAYRHTLLKELWGNDSVKALTMGQFSATLDWVCDDEDDTGDRPINFDAQIEAYAVVTAAMREAGQLDLLPEEEGQSVEE